MFVFKVEIITEGIGPETFPAKSKSCEAPLGKIPEVDENWSKTFVFSEFVDSNGLQYGIKTGISIIYVVVHSFKCI